MTATDRDRIVAAFLALQERDPEAAHQYADELLVEALSLNPGNAEILAAYSELRANKPFWYA